MLKLRKYVAIVNVTVKNQLAYLLNYLTGNLFLVLILSIFYALWRFMTEGGGGTVAGYTLTQLVWYLAFAEIVVMSRGRSYADISSEIKSGAIAYYLNKPYSYPLYQFSVAMGEAAIKLISNVTVALLTAYLLVGPLTTLNLLNLPLVMIAMTLGIILTTLIYMVLAMTAFWFEDNAPFFWIYSKLVFTLGGMLVPIDLFPEWLKTVATRMPFAYVTYGPAKLAVDFDYSAFVDITMMQCLYIVVFSMTIGLIYQKGSVMLNVNGG